MIKNVTKLCLGLIALVILAGAVNIFIPNDMRIKIVELRLKPILRVGTPSAEILAYLEKNNIEHGQDTENLCGYEYKRYNEYRAEGGTQPCKNIAYIHVSIPTRFTPIDAKVAYKLYLDKNEKLEFHTGRMAISFL